MLIRFLLFALFTFSVAAQPAGRNGRPPQLNDAPKAIYFSTHTLPGDSLQKAFITYRIPYSNIVFVKDGDIYSSGFTIIFEVFENDEIVGRESAKEVVKLDDYEQTNSKDTFLQGFVEVDLKPGTYRVHPNVITENTDQSINLPPLPLHIKDPASYSIMEPIVTIDGKLTCSDEILFKLVNYENTIPFSTDDYKVLLPVKDLSVDNVVLKVEQDDELIMRTNLTNPTQTYIMYDKCSGQLAVTDSEEGVKVNLFVLDNYTFKLKEGPSKITVTMQDSVEEFVLHTRWINKPLTLLNAEFAIKLFADVMSDEQAVYLLDGPKEEHYGKLFKYWRKFDPDKETPFNEVMKEFYERADYAAKNYGSVNKRNGARSDRGKIYIKYGQPDKVSRSYSDQDKTLEIWRYDNLNKEFVFADDTGLGNFDLVQLR